MHSTTVVLDACRSDGSFDPLCSFIMCFEDVGVCTYWCEVMSLAITIYMYNLPAAKKDYVPSMSMLDIYLGV